MATATKETPTATIAAPATCGTAVNFETEMYNVPETYEQLIEFIVP